MRQILASVLLAALSFAAFAQTVAFGNKVIRVGDPVGRVFEVAGQPSRTVPRTAQSSSESAAVLPPILPHQFIFWLIVIIDDAEKFVCGLK